MQLHTYVGLPVHRPCIMYTSFDPKYPKYHRYVRMCCFV